MPTKESFYAYTMQTTRIDAWNSQFIHFSCFLTSFFLGIIGVIKVCGSHQSHEFRIRLRKGLFFNFYVPVTGGIIRMLIFLII
jgi:hypothetical protein